MFFIPFPSLTVFVYFCSFHNPITNKTEMLFWGPNPAWISRFCSIHNSITKIAEMLTQKVYMLCLGLEPGLQQC